MTVLPEKILLVDHSSALCRAWTQAFSRYQHIEVIEGDFFAHDADAMVSPANSFGIMDGGLDRAIRDALGSSIESSVQQLILERHHGEIPIGCAEIVATPNPRWPWLVVAPTMRVPESVAQTLNAYVAMRALLLAVSRWNQGGTTPIRSVVIPGLGTGIGGMDPRRCAAQMRMAYDQIAKPARIPSFATIHALHRELRSSS